MAEQLVNPEHKRTMNRLLHKVERLFDDARIYPRGIVFLDKVVLAHVSKSLSVAAAVMRLVDAGLADEAFGMSRTMVEIALNLRFITNRHSEQRAKRFVHYLSRWKLELIRRSLKHFHVVGEDGKFVLDKNGNKIPRHTKSELRQHMREYAAHAKRARKYPSRTSWTETHNRKSKGGVWKMAMEADRYESVNGQPVRWEFDYDWMYFWTSQYVHGTAVALDIHATPVRHPFSVRKAFEVGQVNADLAMFNTAVQLYKILVMAFRALGQPFHPAIEVPLGAFVKRMAK